MTGFVPNWMGNLSLVNVKDYGAVGNGLADDTAAIQLAINTAIGSTHTSDTNFVAIPVYFPPGNYMTTAPIYIVGARGLHLFGAGNGATQIFFQGNPAQGNTLTMAPGDVTTSTLTPVIAIDGVSYSKIELIEIGTPLVNAVVSTMVGILIYQSGSHGYCGSINFSDMNVSNCYGGILGIPGNGNSDNCIFTNILFTTCGMYGIKSFGQNVINWQVYGGGAQGCSWLSAATPSSSGAANAGAAYLSGPGSIGVISGVSCSGNNWDIINNGGQQMFVTGGSFEGTQVFNITASWSGGLATLAVAGGHKMTGTPLINVYQASPSGYNGIYTATVVNSTTLTYTVTNPGGSSSVGKMINANTGSIMADGSAIAISGIAYRPTDSVGCRAIDSLGGYITVSASSINPGNGVGAGEICNMSNGVILFDGCIFNSSLSTSTIKCSGVGSFLYMRGNIWIGGVPSSIFTGFTSGTVAEYDPLKNTTVGTLPAAAAIFKGLRGSVTDANATTFLTTVAPGGSNNVPVFCDGTAWKIG